MNTQFFTVEQTAAMYGVSVDTIKAQYLSNAQGMERMYNKAVATGKKVGGFTADQLKEKIEQFKKLAA